MLRSVMRDEPVYNGGRATLRLVSSVFTSLSGILKTIAYKNLAATSFQLFTRLNFEM